jgi:Fe-S-cluster formation regulator IscX/YfhJ
MVMPEPDPRRIRLAEMRERLLALGKEIELEPFGSATRDPLVNRFADLLALMLELRQELE